MAVGHQFKEPTTDVINKGTKYVQEIKMGVLTPVRYRQFSFSSWMTL
jgi:hypothetical protein